MRSIVLTFLVIFSVLAQGFSVYASATPDSDYDHPIISEAIDHHAVIVTAEACCTDEIAESTTAPCNGGDCKLFFSADASSQISQTDVHSTSLVVEEFSFQNVVRLRPPNA